MATHDDVRRAAMALPGVTEKASYGGRPSWRCKARMFAWIREDPEALVVWVESVEDKQALIDAEPKKFFTTDHYDGHPIVLVELSAVEPDEVAELLEDSWRQRASRAEVKAFDGL